MNCYCSYGGENEGGIVTNDPKPVIRKIRTTPISEEDYALALDSVQLLLPFREDDCE